MRARSLLATLILLFTLVHATPARAFFLCRWMGVSQLPSVDPNYRWNGPQPSKPLWESTLETAKISGFPLPKKGTPLTPLSADDILGGAKRNRKGMYYRDDVGAIVRSGDYEQGLIEASTLDTDPHEVAQLRVICANGDSYRTGRYKGNSETVRIPFDHVSRAISDAATVSPVTEIHYNHTHPVFEFSFDDTDVLAVLSDKDIKVATKISNQHPGIVVVMRASTPAGVTYEGYFLDGVQYETRASLPKNPKAP